LTIEILGFFPGGGTGVSGERCLCPHANGRSLDRCSSAGNARKERRRHLQEENQSKRPLTVKAQRETQTERGKRETVSGKSKESFDGGRGRKGEQGVIFRKL